MSGSEYVCEQERVRLWAAARSIVGGSKESGGQWRETSWGGDDREREQARLWERGESWAVASTIVGVSTIVSRSKHNCGRKESRRRWQVRSWGGEYDCGSEESGRR